MQWGLPLVQYARDHAYLITTPHIGGYGYESMKKTQMVLAEKLVEVLASS